METMARLLGVLVVGALACLPAWGIEPSVNAQPAAGDVVWHPAGQPRPLWPTVGTAPAQTSDPFPHLPALPEERPPWDPRGPLAADPLADDPAALARGRSVQSKTDLWRFSLTSQMAFRDTSFDLDALLPDQTWRTDETVRLDLTGSVFAFSQVNAACNSMATEITQVASRSGLGCKLATWPAGEIQVKGGPAVVVDDSLRPERRQERSEVRLDVQGKWPVGQRLSLEYLGWAVPGLRPTERGRVNQDLGVAVPVAPGAQLKVGAKHGWEGPGDVRPLAEAMQFYLGLSLKR